MTSSIKSIEYPPTDTKGSSNVKTTKITIIGRVDDGDVISTSTAVSGVDGTIVLAEGTARLIASMGIGDDLDEFITAVRKRVEDIHEEEK